MFFMTNAKNRRSRNIDTTVSVAAQQSQNPRVATPIKRRHPPVLDVKPSQYTSTTSQNGRLCNQLIRNMAVSMIAEKHDLYVEYASFDIIDQILGIPLFIGTTAHYITKPLNESNYSEIYESQHLVYNLDPNGAYFQSNPISQMIYKCIQSEPYRHSITQKNPFRERYSTNNDVCVHIRLADVERHNPGINYYLNALKQIEFDGIYIATDDSRHHIVSELVKQYPSAIVLQHDSVKTIQFASTCKNVVLSHGSYSAVIGYLSFYSSVYYPAYEPNKIWFGDMFSNMGWTQVPTQ